MVLFGHLAGTRGFPVSAAIGNRLGLAEVGVHVFFVISGYLITRLLLEELDRNGRISMQSFYIRRTLRIFPPYYTFLGVLFVLWAVGLIVLGPSDLPRALTYTSNYDEQRSWFVGHTWSLSVEEQFYLMWPLLLVASGRRRAIAIAALVVVLAPIVRIVSWEWLRLSGDAIGNRFETVADAIAIGCVLAASRAWLHRQPLYMRGLSSPWFALVPLAGIAAQTLHDHPVADFLVGVSVINLAAALTIDWCVTFATGRVGRLMNARPLVVIGTLSYSLYLWQQLFLNRSASNAVSTFPLNIVLVGAAAASSYLLVERPALNLRRRIEAWRRRPAQPPAAPIMAPAALPDAQAVPDRAL
jgi:peptidoglycan/LPS O-acetylase OafA/YrhL